MGIFDKLFGKKQTQKFTKNQTIQVKKGDAFISADQNSASKVIRPLTDEQKKS